MKTNTENEVLSQNLSKESLWDWEPEYHSAFDSMELSHLKSLPNKDKILEYMVDKINEVVHNRKTPPKVMEVLKEDLEDWIETFGLWSVIEGY